jgi:hypothetical protein
MPRMIDLIRTSALPSHRMQAAARGALTNVTPAEMIEILVHLANNNRIFGQQAKLTLAGYDEAAAMGVAANPATPKEVLQYLMAPENLRPTLLPTLVENPSVSAESIIVLAATGSREIANVIEKSQRASKSVSIQNAVKSNPNWTSAAASAIATEPEINQAPASHQAASASASASQSSDEAITAEFPVISDDSDSDTDPEVLEGLKAYMFEHAGEIAAEQGKPFQPIGGIFDEPVFEEELTNETPSAPAPTTAPGSPSPATTAAKPAAAVRKSLIRQEGKRENTLQKINNLDVKGRIQLAMKGSREERSILIRDGTKVVALAVLESVKLTDSEVESFASQKNVLEAVLRAIPMKRRYAKNYAVLRNIVFNPRTPLDASLGLMKHLLVQDLRNLSSNKEVSDTIRKLALKMFKQKSEIKKKD